MNSRRDLFPPIEPYRTGRSGLMRGTRCTGRSRATRAALPLLFLHGGPGAGATAVHRRFFDPTHWRIVIFDQRGAGRSTPLGEIRDNSPDHLVGDIELLRRELGIDEWLLFGGSWGSTLALHYAETHPERVRRADPARHLPVPGKPRSTGSSTACARSFPRRGAPLPAFCRRRSAAICSPPITAGWSTPTRASTCRRRAPGASTRAPARPCCPTPRRSPPLARTGWRSAWRGSKRIFSPDICSPAERDLIARIGRIRHLPGVIVQGRYDMVCPIRSADELARAWPEAEYVIVPDAGHSAMEPGIREQLVLATERLKRVAETGRATQRFLLAGGADRL